MKAKGWIGVLLGIGLLAAACMERVTVDMKAPRITKEELRAMLDRPDVVILDVRLEDEWKSGKEKIKGAVREDPERDIKSWAPKYPKDRNLVFY